jgi:hypothetical protein
MPPFPFIENEVRAIYELDTLKGRNRMYRFSSGGCAMYCPKCGHEIQESVRFCSRCGFDLRQIKESLSSDPSAKLLPLRQMDINIGAALVLIGAIKALFFGSAVGESDFGLVFLAAGFAVFLLISQLSSRFRGLSLGATLMFIGSLIALLSTNLFGMAGLLVAVILIPLILLWLPLTRAATKFFFEKESNAEESRSSVAGKESPAALPAAQTPVNLKPQPMITAEIVPAPSVTENTTKLLEED